MVAELLAAAESLRWTRPDLMAALADHVRDAARAAGDRDLWLEAAGAAVAARSATGDGRIVAAEVLGELHRVAGGGIGGSAAGDPLASPAARRLRVELALAAVGAGEGETARALLAPVLEAAGELPPALRSDAHLAEARCAADDTDAVAALRAAAGVWARSPLDPPPDGVVVGGQASVAVVAASLARLAGRHADAVDHATAGLADLDAAWGSAGARVAVSAPTVDGHLAAALAAEAVSAEIDAGHHEQARELSERLAARLAGTRPSRQTARLRLGVASVQAGRLGADATIASIERAAREAAESDAPDLESICRSALGSLQEKAGRLDAALEEIRAGLDAQRRDHERETGLVTALDALAVQPFSRGSDVPVPAGGLAASSEPLPGGSDDGMAWLAGSVWAVPTAALPRAVLPISLPARNGSSHSVSGPGVDALDATETTASTTAASPADPWATGLWGGGRHGSGQETGVSEDQRSPAADALGPAVAVSSLLPDRELAIGDTPVPEPTEEFDRADTSTWMATALEELDRVWGRPHIGLPPSAPDTAAAIADLPIADLPIADVPVADLPVAPRTSAETLPRAAPALDPLTASVAEPPLMPQPMPPPMPQSMSQPTSQPGPSTVEGSDAAGCVVVIDLARDGRRFAGRRAGSVVRDVAALVADQVPDGARIRFDETDSLSVVLPGWEGPAATQWMYRTLPGLLAGFVAGEDLPGTQVRAAVHDVDGPVGAQLLHRIDVKPRRPAARGVNGRSRHGADDGRAPFRVRDHHPVASAGGRRRRRAEDEALAVDPPRAEPPPVAQTPAAGSASGASAVAAAGSATSQPEPMGDGRPDYAADTDGLGLADLLAGALAAYRGI